MRLPLLLVHCCCCSCPVWCCCCTSHVVWLSFGSARCLVSNMRAVGVSDAAAAAAEAIGECEKGRGQEEKPENVELAPLEMETEKELELEWEKEPLVASETVVEIKCSHVGFVFLSAFNALPALALRLKKSQVNRNQQKQTTRNSQQTEYSRYWINATTFCHIFFYYKLKMKQQDDRSLQFLEFMLGRNLCTWGDCKVGV